MILWILSCLCVAESPSVFVVLVQSLSRVWFFEVPWTAAHQASLSFTLLEFAQTRVHWVDDAIQPFHSLLPPSPPALNLSQHQGLFQWVTSGGQCFGATSSASVLPVNIKDWFLLGLVGLISLPSKGLSRVFSSTTIQKHQFFSAQPSLWPSSHPYMTTGKTITLTIWKSYVSVL